MDKDSEMILWTDINDVYWPPKEGDNPPPPPIPRNSYIEMDFQKDKVDLMAIHRYLSERCIPNDDGGYKAAEVPVDQSCIAAGDPKALEGFMNWLGQDAVAMDPAQLDAQMHGGNVMLMSDEHVVMAFKVGRDITCFTTRRVFILDTQGFTGKKVLYKSMPYSSIRAFSVCSAGSWDTDSEVTFNVKTYWLEDSPGSEFSQDLRKGKADIMAIQSFLAAQCIGWDPSQGLKTAMPDVGTPDPKGPKGFLDWCADNSHAISAEAIDKQLHASPKILQNDEKAELAFACGRDMVVFTSKRLLRVDVQGFTGKKVEYHSVPLKHLHGFEVRSAGAMAVFARLAHFRVYCDVPGTEMIEQDLSKSETSIWAIQTHLSQRVLARNMPEGWLESEQAAKEAKSLEIAAEKKERAASGIPEPAADPLLEEHDPKEGEAGYVADNAPAAP